MNPLLILYGTTDGHTAKVARFLAGELRGYGATVDVFDARTSNPPWASRCLRSCSLELEARPRKDRRF